METESQTIAFDQLGIQEIKRENQKTIDDYITARKMETNISNYTQLNTFKTLKYFSRHINKNFQDVTRKDIVSFLNSLRKNETQDPNHKWVGTYNLYLVIISTFFKWLYYPKTEPKERPKPEVIQNLKQLKRREKSAYKPTDMWTQDDDILFLKYCPSKRDRCYHAISRDHDYSKIDKFMKKLNNMQQNPYTCMVRIALNLH